MTPSLSRQEKEWRAQDDARTLKNYAELQTDKERLNMAMEILEKEADQITSVLEGNSRAQGII